MSQTIAIAVVSLIVVAAFGPISVLAAAAGLAVAALVCRDGESK